MQLAIDFAHHYENNPVSQAYLDKNREHVNSQCIRLYNLLKSGVRLTVMSAMNDHQIMSLPRRILDIEKRRGIKINRELTGRIVTYYL